MTIRLLPEQFIIQPINDQDVRPLGDNPVMRTGIITQAYSPQMSFSTAQTVIYRFNPDNQFAVDDIVYELVNERDIQFEEIIIPT